MKVVADTMIWISVSVDPDGFRSRPKDDAIVQTAVTAGADYLVTADKEILKLKKVRGVQLITAAEFARLLGWSPE